VAKRLGEVLGLAGMIMSGLGWLYAAIMHHALGTDGMLFVMGVSLIPGAIGFASAYVLIGNNPESSVRTPQQARADAITKASQSAC
jgi:hypothetical protein